MSSSTSVLLTPKAQSLFLEYYRSLQSLQNITRSESRARLEKTDRAYQREEDLTEANQDAKRANATGDADRMQNITVPVVMPQVEAAVSHQASVYLQDTPIFGVVAEPAFIEEALQLETVISENSLRGGWTRELTLFFRDGFKHNISYLEVDWGQVVTATIETVIEKSLKEGVPKEVIWSGNRIKRLDPYNAFIDTRVDPAVAYKEGEFAGYTLFKSRIQLKVFIAELPDKIIANIKPAFESATTTLTGSQAASAMNYYVPSINPKVSGENYKTGGTNWMRWAGLSSTRNTNINYKDSYELTVLYCKVLPAEFEQRVPNSNTPQIYKLIFVNHEHIIYCEKQTNAHGYLPILAGQPLEDGLAYQTKSLADNGIPFQQLTSAHMNAITASRRRAISDRVLYDPSRVTKAAINSSNPSAKIPVRPAAYGKNLQEAVYAFPYREDQQGASVQNIDMLLNMANKVAGQNVTSQGQHIKGNKTNDQFSEVMQNANDRDRLASMLYEFQVFTPMKLILKLNTLQYQGGTTVYNRDAKKVVEIDPVQLRKAVLEFKISDGLTSKARLMKSETFSVAMQVFGSSPEIAAGYNIAPLFSYFMKLQGAHISDFEKGQEQLAYEQALGAWQNLAQLALEKGLDVQKALAPMPLPEQFGYNPNANVPAPTDDSQTPKADQIPGSPDVITPQ